MSDEARQKIMRNQIKLTHQEFSLMVRRARHWTDHLKTLHKSRPCPILDKATCRKTETLLCLP